MIEIYSAIQSDGESTLLNSSLKKPYHKSPHFGNKQYIFTNKFQLCKPLRDNTHCFFIDSLWEHKECVISSLLFDTTGKYEHTHWFFSYVDPLSLNATTGSGNWVCLIAFVNYLWFLEDL